MDDVRRNPQRLVEIDVLGPVRIRIGSTSISLSKARGDLLALLAASPEPIDLLDAARAAHISPRSVRSTLSRIRELLGLERPVHRLEHPRSSRILLDDEAFVVDARLLRQRLAHAELLVQQQHLERAAEVSRHALELWRGDPLGNTAVATSNLGEEVVDSLRRVRARLETIAHGPAAEAGQDRSDRDPDDDSATLVPPVVAAAAVCCLAPFEVDLTLPCQIAGEDRRAALRSLRSWGFTVARGRCRATSAKLTAVLDRMDPTQIGAIHRRAAGLLAPDTVDAPETVDATGRARWRFHVLAGGDHFARLACLAVHLRDAEDARQHDDLRRARSLLQDALELVVDPREGADLLARSALLAQDLGDWADAISDLRRAATIAEHAGDVERAAQLTLALATLTWDPEIGAEVDARLVRLRPELGGRQQLIDRIDLCLAGGTFQDGRSGDARVDPTALGRAIGRIGSIVDPRERAQALIHARKATLDHVPPAESLAFARRIAFDARELLDVEVHGLLASFVDLLRLDRRGAALLTLREWTARWPMGRSASMDFSVHAAHTCWALMVGRYDAAQRHLRAQAALASVLGGATVQQVLAGQRFWLARLLDERAVLEQIGLAAGAAYHQSGSLLWAAVAGSSAQHLDQHDDVARWIDVVTSSGASLSDLPRGPHRLPTLTLLAEQLFQLTVEHPRAGAPRARRRLVTLAEELRGVLVDEPQLGVLAGWPTVFLGPTSYALGLATAAAGDRREATAVLQAALHRNRHSPPLAQLTRQRLAKL